MTQSSPVGTFILTEDQRNWLCRRAFQSAPEEACGFILRDGTIKEIRNNDPYPYKQFRMDSRQLLKINPVDVIAIWHTHPSGKLYPSDVDQKHMTGLGEAYGNWAYLIVTKDDVAQYNTQTDWSKFV
jgi:proteasome lid subunit RPN8/RPN11